MIKKPLLASAGVNRTDQRNREKLTRSPASYFVGRSRELVLAAPYFLRNVKDSAYGGTATAHYHNLCGAAYVAMLSAFEVMWKAIFAGIVDATDEYDSNLVGGNGLRDVVKNESLLAHRSESSAGAVLAASLGTWQSAAFVNKTYKAAFSVEPIATDEMELVDQLWQIRHIIAHGAGVVSRLDAYRLRGIVEPDTSLQLDEEYLRYAEKYLVSIARSGAQRMRDRLLADFFNQMTRTWESDNETFARLWLLTAVVPKTKDLPEVTRDEFNDCRQAYYK